MMDEHSEPIESTEEIIARSTGFMPIRTKPPFPPIDTGDLYPDEDGVDLDNISDEDAQSLINLSISRAATRLTSPRTPAAEKAAAMEGGGFFDSDDDVTPAQTPPTPPSPVLILETHPVQQTVRTNGLSLGKLSSPQPEEQGFPTPWRAGPKPMVIQRPEETRSALRAALAPSKRRSFSGSGDTLRKFLPSLPKAGSFMHNLPSPSFFSSNINQKSRNRGFSASILTAHSAENISKPAASSHVTARAHVTMTGLEPIEKSTITLSPVGAQRSPLRRVTSDDSLLYHSLSRASSLGDDSRFENHHEMINSRVKAIRDTFQDRSSFRLPNMPSMPSIPSMPRVPSFEHAMSYAFNFGGSSQAKSRLNADSMKDILPGNIKRRPNEILNPALNSGRLKGSMMRPETPLEPVRVNSDGPNTSLLDRALADLTGDVVVMGGYRGSILRSAKPPHRQLWVPVKVGLNIRKVNMEVGLEPEDEERMEETIFASGMIQGVGPVDISRRLFKRLRECENAKNGTLRVWDYGYDWRLSPHLLSRKLIEFLEGLKSNEPGKTSGALVIAHSLGGLITRHAVNKRPELFSGVIYAGVPQSCINILGPLRNGDAVLLSSRVLTAQVNFTLRTSFALLPLNGYGFIDKTTREPYIVDFFNADDWIKYRLSPCTDPPLPPKAQPTGSLANMLKSGNLSNLQLPGRKTSNAALKRPSPTASSTALSSSNDADEHEKPRSPPLVARAMGVVENIGGADRTIAPQMGNLQNPVNRGQPTSSSVSTAVTIPRPKAIAYLRRVLAEVKQFKIELGHDASLASQNRYPPFSIIYGKSVPTVYAAKVDGRDGIPCADVYDDLAFASGDGVCLAKEAMLPEGYNLVNGGRISSDRGHVTLLGDLNAVGRAIEAVVKGRGKGLGLGEWQTAQE